MALVCAGRCPGTGRSPQRPGGVDPVASRARARDTGPVNAPGTPATAGASTPLGAGPGDLGADPPGRPGPDEPGPRARQDSLVARFLRYSAVPSQSDAGATTVPSSPGQRELAELLAAELRAAGAADVHLSATSVLTARVPASLPPGHAPVPPVGFCVHLDTADAGLSPRVRARVIDYVGGDVRLSEPWDKGEEDPDAVWLRLSEHPEVGRYTGDRLLVTDGTSVLGADDKAAVATVMEALTDVLADPGIPHGEVYLAAVPDEEIGLRGVRTLDLGRFPVRYAWTLDCCGLGEVCWQTFNAAAVTVRIRGVCAHPMSAKGVLVNPLLVAHDVVARLDRTRTPECTEGTEGFTWAQEMTADPSTATLGLIVRDHDLTRFHGRVQEVLDVVDQVRALHPRARLEVEVEDTYGNIADALTPANRAGIDLVLGAMDALGITPRPVAMRGGTDGSWLSRQGILTPNVFTGAHNFHSACEFLPLSSFERSHALVRTLMTLVARQAARQAP